MYKAYPLVVIFKVWEIKIMEYMDIYKLWFEKTGNAELKNIDPKQIEDRFYKSLEFGTAGLRGKIGLGTNRMNIYVVGQATKGVAEYLKTLPDYEKGVAIAYDSRNMSKEFAKRTALVLAQNGIKAYLYSTLHSVPQLSFTIRHLGCIAGIVITASHNPPEYNGYKVYGKDGGQITPDVAKLVTGYIEKINPFDVEEMGEEKAVECGLLQYIGKEIDEEYYKATQSLLINRDMIEKHGGELKIVYTPLHGSGFVPVCEILKRSGFKNVYTVKEQELPDGNFPTVSVPNPENPEAFNLAKILADKVGANLLIGTDPDSDRLGVCVKTHSGEFRTLTGNQIGAVLLYYILSSKKDIPQNGIVVKSIVSTTLADSIAESFGVKLISVPTGFRFISEKIEEYGNRFIFGFEESHGYLAGGFSRDKDAVFAAMMICEAGAYYLDRGMTLYDALLEIYNKYGYYKEKTISYTFEGKEGVEKISDIMRNLRENGLDSLGGKCVAKTEDFEKMNDFPKSNMIRFTLEDGSTIIARPSGTEPKIKFYIGVNSKSEENSDKMISTLVSAINDMIK